MQKRYDQCDINKYLELKTGKLLVHLSHISNISAYLNVYCENTQIRIGLKIS